MHIENDCGLSVVLASEEETCISTGYTFTEGPVWVPFDTCLLFTDAPENRVHRWRPGDDPNVLAEIYREPSGNSKGLTLDREGRVLFCEEGARQVTRGAYNEPPATLADSYQGKRLNSPNDIVVHSSGAIYFTDPTFGLGPAHESMELSDPCVFRVSPDGEIRLLDDRFRQPNGLCFSPDESLLYISDSLQKVVRRFRVEPDGTIIGGETFVDMRQDPNLGAPDGMRTDTDGRLWAAGAGGVWVIEPGGTALGKLVLPETPTNLAFGGPNFSTLYLTAHTSVYSIETKVRGAAARLWEAGR